MKAGVMSVAHSLASFAASKPGTRTLIDNIGLDNLRTLVITQDVGGFGRASKHLGRTPSAISLQVRRL
jgi:hypothetical protein